MKLFVLPMRPNHFCEIKVSEAMAEIGSSDWLAVQREVADDGCYKNWWLSHKSATAYRSTLKSLNKNKK